MTQGGASGETSGPGSSPGAGASPEVSARRTSDALATGPSAPRERGWWKLVVALLAFALAPFGPARIVLPVEQTLVLLVVALAACTLVGWWAGGKLGLAVAWTALAAYVLVQPAPPGAEALDRLTRGWALLLAASSGLVCVFGRARPLLPRALAAVGIALVVAMVALAFGRTSPGELRGTLEAEIAPRAEQTVAALRAAPMWRRLSDQPETAERAAEIEGMLRESAPGIATVAPALLALESLMALALAWSLFHRMSRARLGAPLARVREFRFNDQLVWGLIVGLITVLLPNLAGFRPVGMNLLVFFGALYALRGFGVLAWFLAPAGYVAAPLIGVALLFWPITGALSLGLGLGDTWANWRTRGAQPTV